MWEGTLWLVSIHYTAAFQISHVYFLRIRSRNVLSRHFTIHYKVDDVILLDTYKAGDVILLYTVWSGWRHFTIQRMICSDRKDNSLLRLLDSPLLIYIATSFLYNNRAEKTTHLFTSCLSLLSLNSQSQPFQHSTMCIEWWTGLGYLEKIESLLNCVVLLHHQNLF